MIGDILINRITSGSRSLTGWNGSNGTPGAHTRTLENGDEIVYTQTASNTTGSGVGPYLRESYAVPAGTISVRAQIKAPVGKQVRLSTTVRNVSTDVGGGSSAYVAGTGGWQDFEVPNVPTGAGTYVQLWALVNGVLNVGEEIRVRRLVLVDGPTAPAHFDGDSPDVASGPGEWFSYGWEGTAGASRTIRTTEGVSEWTRAWWAGLPTAYRDADARQNESTGSFPLLRWMEGAGSIAGDVRELSDALWDGVYTDPLRVPGGDPLRWLAQMLGAPTAQRSKSDADLRQYLIDLVGTGRAAVGTRRAIYEVSKYFLTGDRQVNVVPSSTTPHRIVLLVRADEVPGGDLAALAAAVKASGAVPAGHDVLAQAVTSTWDAWSAAAGTTWSERDARATTWTKSDSLGVQIE